MRKSIVLIMICSIFLVHCYSQYQYVPSEYEYDPADELVSLTLKDNAIHDYEDGDYKFQIKSDSLLIVYKYEVIDGKNFNMVYSDPDTLNLNMVNTLTLSSSDYVASGLLIAVGVVIGIYAFAALSMSISTFKLSGGM